MAGRTIKSITAQIYCSYRIKSRIKKVKFEISKEYFRKIIKRNCHYCNVSPEKSGNFYRGILRYNGVDRKENSKGYVHGNLVPCCPTCNRIKSNTLSYKQMMVLCFALRKLRAMMQTG